MKKRMFDIEIWRKPWFRALPMSEKLAWFLITSECDYIGIWQPVWEEAGLRVGGNVDWDDLLKRVNGNIVVLPGGNWWLVDFCLFQYPAIDESSQSRPMIAVRNELKRRGLWEAYIERKGYVKGIYTAKEEKRREESVIVTEKRREPTGLGGVLVDNSVDNSTEPGLTPEQFDKLREIVGVGKANI